MPFAFRKLLLPLLILSFLGVPAAAYAQITQANAPGVFPAYTHRNTLAFDTVNDVYLMIVWDPPGPTMTGRFLSKAGVPVGGDFLIADDLDAECNPAYATWTSIAFGGPPNDPAFIVTYLVADNGPNTKYARLVRFVPGGAPTVSPRSRIVDVFSEWFAAEKAQSFWNGQQFVVGTRVLVPGQAFPSPQVNLVDMNLNVSPPVNLGDGADFYGSPAIACGSGVCLTVGFKAGISGGYSGGSYGRLFHATTLAPQGTSMLLVSPLGQNEDQGVVYQKHTGLFLTQWFRVSGGYIDTRLVVPDGSMGTTRQAAGPNGGMNAFAYNQFTQTTLLLTKDSQATLYAFELGDDGTPIRPSNLLTVTLWDGAINDYLPAIAVNEEDGQWLVAYRLAGSSFGTLVTGTYVDPTTVPLNIKTNGTKVEATHTLPYAQLMLASGGVIPYTWSLVSGALPPGINLNGAYISGTPTQPGTYNFRLRVTSTDAQVAERDFTLVVQAIIIASPGIGGAQITGGAGLYPSSSLGNRNNLAYDPVNRVYLMTINQDTMPIVGRFLDRNGVAFTWDFVIADDLDPNTGELAFMSWSAITFGGPAGDPTFLITYTLADTAQVNTKYARLVRYVSGGLATVSGRTAITNVGPEWFASEKAQNFWNGQHWVIGTRVRLPGASFPSPQVYTIDIDGNLSAPVNLGDGADFYGSPALTCATNGVCLTVGFKAGITTGYSGGTYARRFNDTTLAPIGPLFALANNSPNEDQGVVYQAHTGRFLAAWWRGGGAGFIDTRLIGTDGAMSIVDSSKGIGPDAGANTIAYNSGTRTSLLVTKRSDAALIVMELGDDGCPLNPSNTVVVTPWDGAINDFYPSIAANHADLQWLVTARLSYGTVGRVIQGLQTGDPYAVQNASFSGGLTGWSQFGQPTPGDLVTTVNNGVLEFYRQPLAPGEPGQGVVFQSLGVGVAAGAPLAAQFDIGNSSTVRKRLSVLIHDLDFSDLHMCSFWLEPGAPLRTYRMRTHTIENWSNLTISFYLASTGSDGGAYRLDNVQVYAVAGQPVDRTECVDPTTPAPVQIPDGSTMLTNGDFSAGLAPWGVFGQITYQIAGGVFEFARPAGVPAGVVLQQTNLALPLHTRLTATLSLGNSSPVRRRVTVIIHDNDFTDLAACTFWVAPGQALSTYRVKLYSTKAWTNATLSVYPAEVDAAQWIRLDDASLLVTPSAALTGTECIEPAPGLSAGATSLARTGELTAGGVTSPLQNRSEGGAQWAAAVTEAGVQAFLWPAPIDLSNASAALLRFDSQLSAGRSQAFVEVTRDGVNWIRLVEIAPTDDWSTVSLDLSDFVGDVVYVRFVYAGLAPIGGTPLEAWAIRDVAVERRSTRVPKLALPSAR